MKKLIIFLLLIPASIFALGQKEITRTHINIASLQGPTSIGLMKIFEEHPEYNDSIVYEMEILNTPDLIVSRLINGELDMAAVPVNLAAILYNRGLDFRLAAVSGYGLLYGVSLEDSIHSFQDLEGKTVYGVGQGSTPEYVSRFLADNQGMTVDFDFSMSQVEIIPQMLSGRIQTAIIPEPFVSILLSRIPDARIFADIQREWTELFDSNYPMSVFLVSQRLIQEQEDFVNWFLKQYEASIVWVNANKQSAGTAAEKHMGLNAGMVSKAIPGMNLNFKTGKDAEKELKNLYSILHSFEPRSVGGKVPDNGFYH